MKLRITIDGQTYEVEVEVLESDESESAELLHEPVLAVPLPPSALETETGASLADSAERETVCRSPVTGIVVNINVEAGQRVEAKDVLLVLESMKMETHVAAHYDATIKSILVAPGNPVRVGQPLVEFEPVSSSPASPKAAASGKSV